MKIKVDRVLYWLSIVRPITDIILGAWKGIEAFLKDEKLAKEKLFIESQVEDRQGLLPSELNDFQKIDYYFNEKEKENGKKL